ncbi:hypothetical protein [Sodalis glossinidius]|uniref:hypothetical protein n=1 Tax=Sodalis glossinidius TaxID=63612 RepID=UPI0011D15877|nr:hypothetical protein [Sodalis glossinidius]
MIDIDAQKIGDKTQQSTTIHDIFINNLPLISTCQLRQNRPNLTAERPTFDEGNPMRYSRFASANSGAGVRVLPEVTATE